MPRPKNVTPTVFLNVGLPMDVKTKLDLLLYSDLKGRVPFGAYQSFIVPLITKELERLAK